MALPWASLSERFISSIRTSVESPPDMASWLRALSYDATGFNTPAVPRL